MSDSASPHLGSPGSTVWVRQSASLGLHFIHTQCSIAITDLCCTFGLAFFSYKVQSILNSVVTHIIIRVGREFFSACFCICLTKLFMKICSDKKILERRSVLLGTRIFTANSRALSSILINFEFV